MFLMKEALALFLCKKIQGVTAEFADACEDGEIDDEEAEELTEDVLKLWVGAFIFPFDSDSSSTENDDSNENTCKNEPTLWSKTCNLGAGILDGAKETLDGLDNIVKHPIDTINSVRSFAENPQYAARVGKAMWEGIKDEFKRDVIDGDANSESYFTGRVLFEAALLFGPAVTKLNKAQKIAKTSEVISEAEKVSKESEVISEVEKITEGISKGEINTAESIKNIINGKGYSVDEFAQLLHPDRMLTDSEKLLVDSIRKEIGLPSADTLMCKTIPQSDIYKYLYNQYDGVRGFTAVEEHGANLKTLLDKYNGARLDYNNTAFKTTNGVDGISQSVGLPDKVYGTIEYKANDVSKISIPDWVPKPDDYPYTGKAFTGSTDVILPEYFQDTRKFVDGDIIKIIDSNTGKVVQQFIYDMDTDTKWVMIGGN